MADFPLVVMAYTLLATNAFFAALLVVVRVRAGVLARRMLLQAATMALMSVYWSLIAISSGPAPAIARADMAGGLRLLAGVTAVVWTIFGLVYLPQVVRRRDAEAGGNQGPQGGGNRGRYRGDNRGAHRGGNSGESG